MKYCVSFSNRILNLSSLSLLLSGLKVAFVFQHIGFASLGWVEVIFALGLGFGEVGIGPGADG